MSATEQPHNQTSDYESIRTVVKGWSPALRAALIHDLINTLVQDTDAGPRRQTLSKALGVLDMGQPAPSDSEVELTIQEQREAKYG